MERDEYLSAVRRDGSAFAGFLAGVPCDHGVPGCPGWSVADLWWHLTGVYHFWSWVVAGRRAELTGYQPPARPGDDSLAAMFTEHHATMVDVLERTPGEVAVWAWPGPATVDFVLRRMAHETAVHAVDAAAAGGAPAAIEPALAADGIDEFLHLFLSGEPLGGSVHLHCTDVPGEWLVVDAPTGFKVTREHAKGACALRGAAGVLLLALWRRAPLETVDVVGDVELAARFVATSSLA